MYVGEGEGEEVKAAGARARMATYGEDKLILILILIGRPPTGRRNGELVFGGPCEHLSRGWVNRALEVATQSSDL